jgi:hypothetical protein
MPPQRAILLPRPGGEKTLQIEDALVKNVENGVLLEDHHDILNGVREQLYAEENQRLEKR